MEASFDLIKQLHDNYEFFRETVKNDVEYPDRFMGITMLVRYYSRMLEEREAGKKIAWVNYAVPSEVLWALDILPAEIDVICGAAAAVSAGKTPQIARP